MRSYAVSPFFLLAFVLGVGGLVFHASPAEQRAGGDTLAGAARVIDGDTLVVAGQRVRLHGIDAPERKQFCRFPALGRYPCGQAAAQLLTRQIAVVSGGHASCAISGRDRYGRAIGVCHDTNGTDLGGWLVAHGWALAYRRSTTTYVPQEDRARANGAGRWAGAFVPPWAWRRGARLDGKEVSDATR